MPFLTSPDPRLYTLGRGVMEIATYGSESYSDVGNCPEFKIKVKEEKLEHKSYRAAIRALDKTVVLESGYEGSFKLDEISVANLNRFVKGTISNNTIRAVTLANQEYSLKFTAMNPVGERFLWTFHRLTLENKGELDLIGDKWTELEFQVNGLSDYENNPTSPFFDIDYLGEATT